MNEIRLGTIGSGMIVREILDGVQQTEGIHLEAVYSRSQASGQEPTARKPSTPTWTPS